MFLKKLKKLLSIKTKTNIFRIQANNSIMCVYFCIDNFKLQCFILITITYTDDIRVDTSLFGFKQTDISFILAAL